MTILVAIYPPSPPDPPSPRFSRYRSPVHSLVNAQGREIILDGSEGYRRLDGTRGHRGSRPDIFSSPFPDGNGDALQGVRRGRNDDPFLSVFIESDTRPGMFAMREALEDHVDAEQGDVTWRVRRPDGQVRELTGRGWVEDGEEDIDWMTCGVHLSALDPTWYGPPISRVYRAQAGRPILGPGSGGLPFRLASSQVLGDTVINNPGRANAWAKWTFLGPFLTVVASKGSRSFGLTGPMLAGQGIVVDTRPGVGTVRDLNGTNVYTRLGAASFFPLSKGDNRVTFTLTGAQPGTEVRVEFQPPYITSGS